jgi:hypothetical protein
MIERDLGDGGYWYAVASAYPTPTAARKAWERAHAGLNAGVGVVRFAPNPDVPALESGIPRGAHAVVAVTLDRATALKAARLLSGAELALRPEFVDAVIARHLHVVQHSLQERGDQWVVIRRPQRRGARLDRMGNLREQDPGHG